MSWLRVCQKNKFVWLLIAVSALNFSCWAEITGFDLLFQSLRQRIAAVQGQAMLLHSNEHRTLLYYEIGKQIALVQFREGWGAKVVARLSKVLREQFPKALGFSKRNLEYMRKFALAYQSLEKEPEVLRLPWFHIVILLDKVANEVHRRFYAQQAIANNWSRRKMVSAIEKRLHQQRSLFEVSAREGLVDTENLDTPVRNFKIASIPLCCVFILPFALCFKVLADLLALKSLL